MARVLLTANFFRRHLRMFHVEHYRLGEIFERLPRQGYPVMQSNLVMQTEQKDDAKDDGREEDLSDMVVEDLLVGLGGVAELVFFLAQCFIGHNGSCWYRYVLFYDHVLDSLDCNTEIPLRLCNVLHGEFPCFQGQGCL
jgi:hypothetical protein